MMIGRPGWFKFRRYVGKGLMPATWQGGVYYLVFLLIIVFIQIQTFINFSPSTRTILTLGTICILLLDTAHIMFQIRKGR